MVRIRVVMGALVADVVWLVGMGFVFRALSLCPNPIQFFNKGKVKYIGCVVQWSIEWGP
jgi:hypothetical protein